MFKCSQQDQRFVLLTNPLLFQPQAHSSVERAALIGAVMMRKVPTDDRYAVREKMLKKMVEEDKLAGLTPFYVKKI